MTVELNGASPDRPVLFGRVGRPRPIDGPTARGSQRVSPGGSGSRGRVQEGIADALEEFVSQEELSTSVNATDPELVLVLEAVEDRTDLLEVARRVGLEVLVEADSWFDPDDEYSLLSTQARDRVIRSSIHAVCADRAGLDALTAAWRTWTSTGAVPGNAPLRDLFSHLRDLRPWGVEDRLQTIDWDDYFDGLIEGVSHSIEIELWYRRSPQKRQSVVEEVEALIREADGVILGVAEIDAIGYHAIKAEVSTDVLRALANGTYDAVRVVKSANVMFLRVRGQSLRDYSDGTLAGGSDAFAPLPAGDPVAVLLDGVPASNHPLLRGRLVIYDPDDLAADAPVDQRSHGTWMSSAVIWGDLSDSPASALSRPLLVRPILVPAADTVSGSEELGRTELAPDLMWRVFRELYEGDDAIAHHAAVLNLSVGDPAAPFDSLISSWARVLDWLSHHYGVLVIISAGNHRRLTLTGTDSVAVSRLSGAERRHAVHEAQVNHSPARGLLAPAESVNSVTVGAIHSDGSGPVPPGYVVDPADGLLATSPISALGPGYRRSVKPDLSAPGGRVVFQTPLAAEDELVFRSGGAIGPGVRVADPRRDGEIFTSGSSPAAAFATRQVALLYEGIGQLKDGRLSRRERALVAKALLAHDRQFEAGHDLGHEVTRLAGGHGTIGRNLANGCAANEAVVVYLGALSPRSAQELEFPLPDGLGQVGPKQVIATLAWFSPVNWRHRQYRQASLSFAKPDGDIPDLGTAVGLAADDAKRGATTLQRVMWETNRSFAGGRGGHMRLTVKCQGQAGLQDNQPIPYAVALSLRVAAGLGVEVYQQVRDQLRIPIRPRPNS